MSSPTLDRAHLLEAFNHQTQLFTAAIVMFEQAAADQLKINVTDLHCANVLRLMGPMTAGQLAELTSLTTGAITGVIDRLEGAGYVRRESDPADRRRVVVQAEAEAMEREIGPLYTPLAQATAAMIARYSDQELAVLVDQLTRSNALTVDQAIKLRRTTTKAHDTNAGVEIAGEHVAVPLGSVQAGHLIFTTGATRLSISGGAAQAELFRAHFGKLTPSVYVEDGLVKVFYQRSMLNWSAGTADLTLNSAIPWRLDVVISGATCGVDLRSVVLNGLDVNGKASNIEILLPRPTAHVPFRIAGNASNVVVRRAAGSAIRVRSGRGVSNLVIDGQDVTALGSKPYLTPNYAATSHRYDIDVTARLTALTIETYE